MRVEGGLPGAAPSPPSSSRAPPSLSSGVGGGGTARTLAPEALSAAFDSAYSPVGIKGVAALEPLDDASDPWSRPSSNASTATGQTNEFDPSRPNSSSTISLHGAMGDQPLAAAGASSSSAATAVAAAVLQATGGRSDAAEAVAPSPKRSDSTDGSSRPTSSAAGGEGEAITMTDEALVEMLRLPPKHVPRLRTREGFRRFFSGMSETRMTALLMAAYDDREPAEQFKRVNKRISLVTDVLQKDEAKAKGGDA